MESLVAGQRWVSDSEPDLGLGIVLSAEYGRVELHFPAVEETRAYAVESAPLRRVVFSKGDKILTVCGKEYEVCSVSNRNGAVTYLVEEGEVEVEISEVELSETMVLNKPQDRLLGGMVDDAHTFALRKEALRRNYQIKKSPLRGFVGGRTDLIPHQLSIVNEVVQRLKPRVLLADEVGLGKTIEACMIMHRLHLTGRADRVLILLPESLVHQWFVELLRRFNMLFSLFDEERCQAIEEHQDCNPFLDSQLVIADVEFLAHDEKRADQLVEAGWDMLIVDEAHHLEWNEDEPSESYMLVERLSHQVDSLLLLTATPQQLGQEGHFARLRLLDPERFSNLTEFLKEAERYEAVASLIDKIKSGGTPSGEELEWFSSHSQRVKEDLALLGSGDGVVRERLVNDLLDGFGTGRVMFRNTREHLSGFPKRTAHLSPLKGDKIDWLVELLRELKGEKILLIAKTKEAVDAISEGLRERMQVNLAVFHEDLTLLQRDRNAAYFSNEEGARILLCSEIGSEGRNFQFAHHLVLYDLPENPDLLEQRIGRLDRIGQTGEIHIHVPFQQGSDEQIAAQWYHDGLGAFEKNVHGVTQIHQACADLLDDALATKSDAATDKLIAFTKEEVSKVETMLASGQDKLLALNSFRGKDSEALIEQIENVDADGRLEAFVLRMLDHFGVAVEDLGERTYLLKTGNMTTDIIGDIPDEGMAVTFDRNKALSREEMQFMSMDHPVVLSCLDSLLGSEAGNVSFGVWESGSNDKRIIIEAHFLAESLAPSHLHVDRFLPASPIRVAMSHQHEDLTDDLLLSKANLRQGNVRKLLAKEVVKQQLIPAMIEKSEALAEEKKRIIIKSALAEMEKVLDQEIHRMEDLAMVNDVVSNAEIQDLKQQRTQLKDALNNTRLRLDALRPIWKES